MAATIKDIARIAGVSPSTVSRSLNNSRQISEEMRNRIVSIAEEHGFEFNASARSLSTSYSGTIGVILPDNYAEFNNRLYLGALHDQLAKTLEKNDLYLIVTYENNGYTMTSNIKKLVTSKKVDGLIIAKSGLEEDILTFLRKNKVPHVLLHHFADSNMNSNVNRVCTDHFRGGYLATEHLIRLGHKKIATITAGGEGNEYELRFAGYRAALADYDISYDDALGFTGDETFQTAYQIVMDNQKSFAGVSAVFVQNDMMAFGVKEAFGELGIRIPSDVALVGYDDVELCTMFKPHLTTIHQPKEESAALACEFLLDLIRDKSSSSKEIRVSPTLVVRQSCGANSVQ